MSLASHILAEEPSRPRVQRPGPFDVGAVRADFPILDQRVRGRPLVYLDNAATAQKPRRVIHALHRYYALENANVHRGVHHLSQVATDAYEEGRHKVGRFLNAAHDSEIVFVRGTTEGINLVAQTFGRQRVGAGDEVLISEMEHHSNIVPWQMLCEEKGARLRVIPINDRGELLLEEYEKLLTPRTKLVSVAHVSNVLGTLNPASDIVRLAHERGVPVLFDGAQAVPHLEVDVQALDCDFYAFSGHKLYGPTGVGVLYGKAEHLESMPPYQGGGSMIRSVTFERTTYAGPPNRFEAGTPQIAGGIGLGAAIDYLAEIGLNDASAYEADLLSYATHVLSDIPDLRLIGTADEKVSVLSFVVEGIHPHDIGTVLDQEGVAVRAGHHCAQPLMRRFGISATTRAAIACYNTRHDIDALARGLRKVREIF